MSDGITLCIVGAGSSYTPELIEGIVAQDREALPVDAIRMMDIDAERLGVMVGLSERMVSQAERDVRITSGTRLGEMLSGADYVITQIRVGGMAARHLDESIPLQYGIVGQETTGPGGMFKALRTIPAMLEIARAVEEAAPQAYILNYTNPSGIITEAVSKHSRARIIGLCSGIPGIQYQLKTQLEPLYADLRMYSVGLNHLGFIYRLVSDGQDVTREAIDFLRAQAGGDREWLELAHLLGAFPMRGYISLYYHHARRVQEMQARGKTRAQTVAEIEEQVFAEAAKTETASKPEALRQRGGGGYSDITFSVLKAIHHDMGEELVMSAPNGGAVQGIPDDAVVEVTCRVGADGPSPLPVGPIPLPFRGLVQAVKAYESLTVEAAVKRDRTVALQALLHHPLVGDLDVAEPLLDEMLRAHGLDFA